MSAVIKRGSQTLSSRVLLVLGSKSVGKTTFCVSGSQYTPATLPAKPTIHCKDVVILQSDTGGVLGPLALGLEPDVVDLSGCTKMQDWDKLFNEAVRDLRPLFANGTYRVLGIDLTALDKMWRQVFVAEAETDSPKNWDSVSAKALAVYRMLRDLPNVTLVGMAHVNVPAEIASRTDATVLTRMQASRDAQAVGGERATMTADLSKGFKSVWVNNADAVLALRRKKEGGVAKHTVRLTPNKSIESGGRWESYFKDEEPALLYPMLKTVYGDKA